MERNGVCTAGPTCQMWELNMDHLDSTLRTHPPSPRVVAYPSQGGIVVGSWSEPYIRERLGLDKDVEAESMPRSTDQTVEDEFALRMLQLGANWWPSWRFYCKHRWYASLGHGLGGDGPGPYGFHYPPSQMVGYPSGGGVVVLCYRTAQEEWVPTVNPNGEGAEYGEGVLDRPPHRTSWSHIRDMDEYCEAIKHEGGRWYVSVENCPNLPSTLEEGMTWGRKYQGLMERLERDGWDEKYFVEAYPDLVVAVRRNRAAADDAQRRGSSTFGSCLVQ